MIEEIKRISGLTSISGLGVAQSNDLVSVEKKYEYGVRIIAVCRINIYFLSTRAHFIGRCTRMREYDTLFLQVGVYARVQVSLLMERFEYVSGFATTNGFFFFAELVNVL